MFLVVSVSVAFAAFQVGQRGAQRAVRAAAHRTEQTVAPASMTTVEPPPAPVAAPGGPVPGPAPPVLLRAASVGRPGNDAGAVRPAAGPSDAAFEAGEGTLPEPEDEPMPDAGVAIAARPVEPAPPPGPVSCGSNWCAPGLVCCNAACGLCAPPGVVCSQRMCGVATAPVSVLCGMATCNVGYVCCNASCGTCVLPGRTCDLRSCGRDMQFPTVETCGFSTCNSGFECCNPSCGTCVRPGESCSHDPCGW